MYSSCHLCLFPLTSRFAEKGVVYLGKTYNGANALQGAHSSAGQEIPGHDHQHFSSHYLTMHSDMQIIKYIQNFRHTSLQERN